MSSNENLACVEIPHAGTNFTLFAFEPSVAYTLALIATAVNTALTTVLFASFDKSHQLLHKVVVQGPFLYLAGFFTKND